MRMFWKSVLANVLASFITLAVLVMMFFVGLFFLVALIAGKPRPESGVHKNSVLVFDLNVNITDSPPHAGPTEIFAGAGSRLSLYEVLNAIDEAAKDKRIVALYLTGRLEPANGGSSYAALREVRQAIQRFKASGKKVYAYLEDPSLKDYYLATTADEVAMNPFSFLSLNGLAADEMFLGDALKKYGVGVQITRVGRYKSATEIFTENHMSEADRTQLTELLDGIWGSVLNDLAESRRQLDVAQLRELSNAPGLFLAEDAREKKLVDKLLYLDQMIEQLKNVGEENEDNYSFYQVALSDYAKRLTAKRKLAADGLFASSDHVAVVYAEGEIVDGYGGAGEVGGDQLAYYLRYLRNDESVKAVVLRVNSPGGSASASEVIQREVRNLREAKKPVIVSMGAMAASGGYWISAYGDYIYAEPTTITGSIGVFGLKFNLKDIANEHGIAFDGVKTAKFADIDTLSRPWTPDEVALAQTLVDFIYDEFLQKVSQGRNLDLDRVREIAQGRVWSGAAAKDLGLVDQIGGLNDAIAKAAAAAGLKPDGWTLMELPDRRTAAEAFLLALAGDEQSSPVAQAGGVLPMPARHDPLSVSLHELETQWHFLRTFNDPRGIYLRLPFMLRF